MLLVRKSKTVSNEKPKQNLKREKEEKELLRGGEGKFTIPTRCVHRTKREKRMIKETDQKKGSVYEMGFLYDQVKRRKAVKETIQKGDLFHFALHVLPTRGLSLRAYYQSLS